MLRKSRKSCTFAAVCNLIRMTDAKIIIKIFNTMSHFTPPHVANGDIKENYNNSQRLGGA